MRVESRRVQLSILIRADNQQHMLNMEIFFANLKQIYKDH